MLTSIPATTLNQINDQMEIPNRFNQSEIDSSHAYIKANRAYGREVEGTTFRR
jgi:hypothetical protein